MTAIAAPLGEAVVSSKGYTLDLGDAGLLMAGHIAVATVLGGMLGVVVGALTRNPTTAMVVIFGVWIAEKIAGGWLGEAGHYLPFTLIESTLGLIKPMAWGYAALALSGVIAGLGLAAQRLPCRATSLRSRSRGSPTCRRGRSPPRPRRPSPCPAPWPGRRPRRRRRRRRRG